MKYTITINEIDEESSVEMVRYQQTVDYVDMQAVISAVNSTPIGARQRALRSDAGKPRKTIFPRNVPEIPATTEDE